MELFADRILPFHVAAAKRSDLAVKTRAAGKAFPAPDGYIAAIAACRGFTVAARHTSAFDAAGVAVINPWNVLRAARVAPHSPAEATCQRGPYAF